MKVSYRTSEEYFNKLNMIFHGIIAATLLPFAILFLGRQKDKYPPLLEGNIAIAITVALLLIAGITVYISFRKFKEAFQAYSKEVTLREKLDFYFTTAINRYLMLGVASVCAILGLLLNTHGVFVLFYLFVLFVFSLGRPDIRKLMDQLALNDEERKLVQEKLEIEP